jgi:hypothetical protein
MVVNGGIFTAVDKLPLIQLSPFARGLASLYVSHGKSRLVSQGLRNCIGSLECTRKANPH